MVVGSSGSSLVTSTSLLEVLVLVLVLVYW